MLFRFFGCYKTIIKDTLEKAKNRGLLQKISCFYD